MKKCNVAVIGLGKMGLLHTSILSVIPNVRLISVCDQKKTITKMAKKFLPKSIKVVNDLDLLSAFDIDAVFVTTPISTHYRVCQEIYHKITSNIFTEKTLAAGLSESEQLCKMAMQFGGLNAVGYQKRYCVTYRKARELFNEGIIGTVEKFKAYSFSSDFVNLTQESLMKTSRARGGVLRDLGAHAIDLASWFFGDIAPIAPPAISSNDACVSFKVRDLKNRCGQVETSWTKEGYRLPETGLVIEGSKGTLLVNDDKVVFKNQGLIKKWYRQDLADNVAFLLWAPEYYRQDLHFIQCIMNEDRLSDSLSNFSQASRVDKLISQVLSK